MAARLASAASNLFVKPGADDLARLMRNAGKGLFVTDMFSPSLNMNTGDWSVGVAGFWFENGEIAHPVSEVTVAGNLLDIYARLRSRRRSRQSRRARNSQLDRG